MGTLLMALISRSKEDSGDAITIQSSYSAKELAVQHHRLVIALVARVFPPLHLSRVVVMMMRSGLDHWLRYVG